MEHVFGKEDLWDWIESTNNKESGAMSGSTTKASGSRFAAATSMGLKNPTLIRQELNLQWKRRRKALDILKLLLTEGLQDFISKLRDPKAAWLKLQKLYQIHTLIDVIVLGNKWSTACMMNNIDVSAFMQLIYRFLRELRVASQQIDDATIVYKILTHLPSCFNQFVSVV